MDQTIPKIVVLIRREFLVQCIVMIDNDAMKYIHIN